MEIIKNTLNEFLVDIYDTLLKREELALASGGFADLSVKEMHLIDAVRRANELRDNSSRAVAKILQITAGSLTTAAAALEKKGYITRYKDLKDKRIVRLCTTEKGDMAFAHHKKFHEQLVDSVTAILSVGEAEVFAKGIAKVTDFFKGCNSKERD